jgi:hypothetical protein
VCLTNEISAPERGPNKTAQGNALGSTNWLHIIIPALKGRHKIIVGNAFYRPCRAKEMFSLCFLNSQGDALGRSTNANVSSALKGRYKVTRGCTLEMDLD